MKLISVKILGEDFRSLSSNKLYQFNVNQKVDRLSTKIFAGLNGSGKSNFLELLTEIFYYLELFHLKTVPKTEKKGNNLGFEIEYILPLPNPNSQGIQYADDSSEFEAHIRIVKQLGEFPEFSKKYVGQQHFERVDSGTELLLPKKVIAYSSGQNELLSNPFFKIRYHYFKELKKFDSTKEEYLPRNDRFFFLDDSSNFSIFVSNLLLASPDKLEYLKRIFKVADLHSFRITINLVDYRKKEIFLNEGLQNYIKKLKLCATSWIQRKKDNEDILILDYKIDDNNATKDAFNFHFTSSFELFKVFYELDNLNLHMVAIDTRSLIIRAHRSLNISDEMPRPDPSRLIFRIEKIYLKKIIEENVPPKLIYYKGLSDGEHQFNEVIGSVMMMEEDGCLFLLDEPDTHFNPKWRAKMIEMLNYVTAVRYDSNGKPEAVRKQEIIITTHSPFVIGDSQTEDVYKFDKINGEVTYVNPKMETYGASVSLLLQEIFDRKISISDLSNFDLEELRNAFKQLNSPDAIRAKIIETKSKLERFGESIEKFDLYSLLRQIEKDLDMKL